MTNPPSTRQTEPAKRTTQSRTSLGWGKVIGEAVFCMTERMRTTLFGMIGIAVGIAAVVATVGAAASGGASVLMSFDTTQARTMTAQPARGASTQLTSTGLAAIQELPGVASAGAYVHLEDVTARTLPPWDDALGGVTVQTYSVTEGLQAACSCTIRAGRWFSPADEGLPRVVLGAGAAAALNVNRVGGGRAIFLNDDPYQVIGIIQTSTEAPLSNGVLLLWPMPSASQSAFTAMVIQADPAHGQVVRKAITIALDPNQTGGITVSDLVDYSAVEGRIRGDIDSLYIVLGGLSMLVGAISITNTRLMAVFERSGEIGLRRALGATHGTIMSQFALESAILGLIGGLVGSAVGVLTTVIIAAAHGWPPVLAIWVPMAGPPVGLAIGTLAGLYPAIRASRVEPVAALRGDG